MSRWDLQALEDKTIIVCLFCLAQPFFVRPGYLDIKACTTDDVQSPSHDVFGRVGHHSALGATWPSPQAQQRLGVVHRFRKHQLVIALPKTGGGELSMHTPVGTLGRDEVLAKQVQTTIHLQRLREVVASGSNLGDYLRISYEGCESPWRSHEEDIGACFSERLVADPMSPFRVQETV